MAKREWPQGRAGPEDDGEQQIAMGVDEQHKIIKIVFKTPTVWIGLPLAEARAFRDMLNKHITTLEEIT